MVPSELLDPGDLEAQGISMASLNAVPRSVENTVAWKMMSKFFNSDNCHKEVIRDGVNTLANQASLDDFDESAAMNRQATRMVSGRQRRKTEENGDERNFLALPRAPSFHKNRAERSTTVRGSTMARRSMARQPKTTMMAMHRVSSRPFVSAFVSRAEEPAADRFLPGQVAPEVSRISKIVKPDSDRREDTSRIMDAALRPSSYGHHASRFRRIRTMVESGRSARLAKAWQRIQQYWRTVTRRIRKRHSVMREVTLRPESSSRIYESIIRDKRIDAMQWDSAATGVDILDDCAYSTWSVTLCLAQKGNSW